MPTSHEDLFGCDTLVATADRSIIFAKNSPQPLSHKRRGEGKTVEELVR